MSPDHRTERRIKWRARRLVMAVYLPAAAAGLAVAAFVTLGPRPMSDAATLHNLMIQQVVMPDSFPPGSIFVFERSNPDNYTCVDVTYGKAGSWNSMNFQVEEGQVYEITGYLGPDCATAGDRYNAADVTVPSGLSTDNYWVVPNFGP